MSTSTYFRSRVDTRPLAAVLAAGDLLALTVFIVAGASHHSERPFANPEIVIGALAPFVLAWAGVAFVAGLYTADAVISVRRAIGWTTPVWVFAALLAHGLRATPLFRGNTGVLFLLVTLAVGGVLVVGWRTLASVIVGHRSLTVG
ncbi:MAG: hypothetical protein ACI8XM_001731 [Haloarculaceae archaeon]|jgi:hypothetical protein